MHKISLTSSIKEIHSYKEFLQSGYDLRDATVQCVDFTKQEINWASLDILNTTFLGCHLNEDDQLKIIKQGGVIFPKSPNVCYEPYRNHLYTWQELYKGNDQSVSKDLEIYNHFSDTKFNPSMMDALLQRVHDHCIDDALRDYLKPDDAGGYGHKGVGIMGGHGTLRTDEYYKKVARTAQLLSAEGYLVMSGGGPGTMEAANLGAYMGKYTEADLQDAIKTLSSAPYFTDDGFHELSITVLETYPDGMESLAIPTWFYGHEPSNVFATHIAKYFSNSIREDTLLATALHGILYAPGSAGTTQEIFMDAAQNHYATFDYISPMIFMGKKRYTQDTNLYSTIQQLSKGKKYGEMIKLVDTPDDALAAFKSLPPVKAYK